MKLHCDECGYEAPQAPGPQAFRKKAKSKGWYVSYKKTISGLPWYLFCPDCIDEYGIHGLFQRDMEERSKHKVEALKNRLV